MKKMPKKQFDELVRLSRSFWEDFDEPAISKRIDVAQEITKLTGIDWLAILYFVDSIIRKGGLLHGASDYMLYHLLGQLGWEITDEVKEIESV